MSTMNGSAYLAEALKQAGLTHLFHVPTAFFGTMVALEGSGVQRVLTHGEKAAAYMADGYARASGKPGLCMAQSIGAANLAAGMADPFLACSPVIAMTGALNPMHRYRHAYQEFEHDQFQGVTKWGAQVDHAERFPYLLRQAFRMATTGSPGPVYLDVLEEAQNGPVAQPLYVEEAFRAYPPFRPAPDPAEIRQAATLLRQAKRPVIVAGSGVIASGAWDEVRELAEALTIPVATSLNGKGSLPGSHPLSIGVIGRYSRWCANQMVCEADLVLFIGTRAGGMTTWDWRIPPANARTIQINIDPVELGRNYPAEVAVLADARLALQALIQEAGSREPDMAQLAEVARLTSAWKAEFAEIQTSDAIPIRTERLCKELDDWLPEDALLLADTGHSGIWTGTMVDVKQPGRSFIRSAGSLGWGLPGAIGAKCAAPDRPVVLFTGDGGFWYHVAELETAVRHGIAPIIVVNDNHSLNQEFNPIREAYGGELYGDALELMMFTEVNLAKLAEVMGCHAERVERPEDIQPALERARQSGRISVVDVVTDINAMGPTPRIP